MNRYSHLTLDELARLILSEPANFFALHEWFLRTKHIGAQAAREAARGAS